MIRYLRLIKRPFRYFNLSLNISLEKQSKIQKIKVIIDAKAELYSSKVK